MYISQKFVRAGCYIDNIPLLTGRIIPTVLDIGGDSARTGAINRCVGCSVRICADARVRICENKVVAERGETVVTASRRVVTLNHFPDFFSIKGKLQAL